MRGVKLLVDVNLSPRWVTLLTSDGLEAIRWSEVGAVDAPDPTIMRYAEREDYVVPTHDQDFGTLLAYSRQGKPSVILLRTTSLRVGTVGPRLLKALHAAREDLVMGAILVIEDKRVRLRNLPIS